MPSREYQQVHWALAAGFVVCRFDLDIKFSELVGCLASDSNNNLSHSTDDCNMDTDGSLESFIEQWWYATPKMMSLYVCVFSAARDSHIT